MTIYIGYVYRMVGLIGCCDWGFVLEIEFGDWSLMSDMVSVTALDANI